MLIPNRNYHDLFPQTTPPQTTTTKKEETTTIQTIQNIGTTTVLNHIANQLQLTQTLQTTFPTNHTQLLTTAQYILCKGNTLSYIENWLNQTKTQLTNQTFTDIHASKLFANINPEEKTDFFINWIKTRKDKEYHAYDVTSISTHSNNLELAEWGYNRDHDLLPQINLTLLRSNLKHTRILRPLQRQHTRQILLRIYDDYSSKRRPKHYKSNFRPYFCNRG